MAASVKWNHHLRWKLVATGDTIVSTFSLFSWRRRKKNRFPHKCKIYISACMNVFLSPPLVTLMNFTNSPADYTLLKPINFVKTQSGIRCWRTPLRRQRAAKGVLWRTEVTPQVWRGEATKAPSMFTQVANQNATGRQSEARRPRPPRV